MRWKVYFRKKVEKMVMKMPHKEQVLFANLIEDLEVKGPIRKEWPNFSKFSYNTYHCHLTYSWIACWKVRKKVFEIEVYYAGSREKAPY